MISDYRYNDTVRISCLFLGRDISQRCLQELPFVLLFVVQKNATESTVIRVNNRNMRIKCVQMGAYAYFGTRFSSRVCLKSVHAFCVCVGCLSLTCTIVSWTPGLTQISCKGVDAEAWWTFSQLTVSNIAVSIGPGAQEATEVLSNCGQLPLLVTSFRYYSLQNLR